MPSYVPDAGKYDKFLVLQQATETNTRGTVTQPWTDVADLWCSLWPLQGREFYSSQQVQADVTHLARTWWRDDVTPTPKMRLIAPDETNANDTTRTFEIRSVIDVEERHQEWELRLTEKV